MVAKIKVSASLGKALNYNEQKVKQGKAECIAAHNYLKDAEEMNFYEKKERFDRQNELNTRAETNTMHISLNFDPSETLSKEQLKQIAETYIKKIGFGYQPYLVYIHHDAGHPHIHIVTTTIQADGKRINTHNIGRNQSEQARKEIEKEFKLVKAEGRKKNEMQIIKPAQAQKAIYGKSETRQAIANVLATIINDYKYTSLAELNAILGQYNVVAHRGSEESIMFKKGGLVFKVLDKDGKPVGIPLKASSLPGKPTLANLEKKFEANKISRQEYKRGLKTTIDWIMIKPPKSLEKLQEALQKEKITLVLRKNDEGIVYGMTYIDHKNKTVFNGSDIGPAYSAKAMKEKINVSHRQTNIPEISKQIEKQSQKMPEIKQKQNHEITTKDPDNNYHAHDEGIVETIIKAEYNNQNTPYELRKKKRKQRKSKN